MSYPQTPPPPTSGEGLTSSDRLWGAAAHVGSLVTAYLALGLIGPLIVLMLKGNESPFVRRHAVESLNFQISLLLYLAVAFLAVLFTFGLALLVLAPVAFVVAVFALIAIIMGTLAANQGQDFRYPLCIRLVK